MKTVIFDIDAIGRKDTDGVLWTRPHFDLLINYLAINKVHVYLAGILEHDIPSGIAAYITGVFRKEEAPPRQPDLVITVDESLAKRFSSIVIPPYTEQFNEFASLSLAGNLLDTLKDRIVLGKQAEEIEKVEPESKKDDDEDVTNFSFSL